MFRGAHGPDEREAVNDAEAETTAEAVRLKESLVLSAVEDEHDGLAALRALIGPGLDGNPEAWVLAAHMLPDFAGSGSEPSSTAAAASG